MLIVLVGEEIGGDGDLGIVHVHIALRFVDSLIFLLARVTFIFALLRVPIGLMLLLCIRHSGCLAILLGDELWVLDIVDHVRLGNLGYGRMIGFLLTL